MFLQSKAVSPASNPQFGGLDHRIYIPRNSVTQLHSQAPGSLFDAFYNSQGYGGGILIRLHAGKKEEI
jgi:hypothetical protein